MRLINISLTYTHHTTKNYARCVERKKKYNNCQIIQNVFDDYIASSCRQNHSPSLPHSLQLQTSVSQISILIGENKGMNDVALDFKFLEIIFQLKGQPIPYVLLHGAIIVPFFFLFLFTEGK